jgi:uncharacterized protein (DUF1778 family)
MQVNNHRAALLVRCSEEEAVVIREAAKREHRTISGYVLNLVMNHVNKEPEHE